MRAKKVKREVKNLDIEMRPQDLMLPTSSGLDKVVRGISEQWGDSRIGAMEVYFDKAGAFHMHFFGRGTELQKKGKLRHVPVGNMSGYGFHPSMNDSGSLAGDVGELLAALPMVDSGDDRWAQISEILYDMHQYPKGRS